MRHQRRPTSILAVLLNLIFLSSCGNSDKEIHLIPAGYEGPVVLIFEQPSGTVPQREHGAVVYRIETNGTLIVKDSQLWGQMQFFYLDQDGRRRRLRTYEEKNIQPNEVIVRRVQRGSLNNTFRVKGDVQYTDSADAKKYTVYSIGQPNTMGIDDELRGAVRSAMEKLK